VRGWEVRLRRYAFVHWWRIGRANNWWRDACCNRLISTQENGSIGTIVVWCV